MILLTYVYNRRGQASAKKSAVVELRITANRKRKYISTGIQLFPKEWSNGSVVGRKDWKELNDQLQVIYKRCSEIINRMMDEGCVDIDAIPNLLNASMMQNKTFVEYAKELCEGRFAKIALGTRKRYLVFFKFIEEWKGIVYFSDITERNVLKMDNVLIHRGLKESSRYNYHKILKVFIRHAVDDGLVKRNPYSRLEIKRGDTNGLARCLTPDEFHNMESCDIPYERLARVRDLFVFQTYTLMSYSDLAEFKFKDCVEVNGNMVYKSKRKKNGQEFTVVLLKPALDILEKYKYKLPIISNEKYNDYLKSVATLANINKSVTTHWARHTGATLLLNEGKVPIHVVQHILGHASIRETERTYAKVLDNTIVESMANYQKMIR